MKCYNYLIVIALFICNLGWAQSLQIETKNIKVAVGDSIQLVATFYDGTNTAVDTTIEWSVSPAELGEFKQDGLFVALLAGKGDVVLLLGVDDAFALPQAGFLYLRQLLRQAGFCTGKTHVLVLL